jgi:chromate reductase, NAD(P)H dehydrogenase (quinone)
MGESLRVLLVSGSLRDGSTNTAVLRTASELAGENVTTVLYSGMATLPHFNPDDDREGQPVHPAVAPLRSEVAAADALLLCTPEYAGALPGALKNLLEWTVGDAGTYRKPIAWINASGPAAPTGGADAHDSLRKVLGYVHADIVEAACTRIALTRDAIGPARDGHRSLVARADRASAHRARAPRHRPPSSLTGPGSDRAGFGGHGSRGSG